METANTELMDLLQNAAKDRDMAPDGIPGIDLYMDQIITLFNEQISPGGRADGERTLTKTMVNNYSKDGIIKPIKGKKYSKEQIMQMLYIYRLKQALSIGDIRRVLQAMPADGQGSQEKNLISVYESFQQSKESSAQALLSLSGQLCPEPDMAGIVELVVELSWVSHTARKMCEALIDRYMPEKEPSRSGKKQEKQQSGE
ncbi:MAG: DUF1836 domain-containing protein [Oscillospiraceae bacterium]|nr:DUF1836 domain-containing protein [Oscillospiraceae bacterium]